MVKSGLDPHMIIELKDKLKLWFRMILGYGYRLFQDSKFCVMHLDIYLT
jgi:hypothetical protein